MVYVIGMLLLLGILVFIHEFGHFYVAKICGMKVETFSIGMGHKILKFKRGETEYALSWMPFGGYVKILGQDPREVIAPEEQHRSFSKMPLWKRIAVVIAGPAANFILAFAVFMILFTSGFPSPSSKIQFVTPNSPAAVAGFMAGDKIVKVHTTESTQNNSVIEAEIRELSDLQRFLKLTTSSSLEFTVDRKGSPLTITAPIVDGKMMDPLTGMDRESKVVQGMDFQSHASIFTAEPNSELSKAITTPYFFIESVTLAGQKTESSMFYILEDLWQKAAGQKATLEYRVIDLNQKEGEYAQAKVDVDVPANSSLKSFGFVPAHLLVTQILAGSAAEKVGLQPGDLIVELNRESVWTFQQFRNKLQEIATSGQSLHIKWWRNSKLSEGQFTPQQVDQENPVTQLKEKKFQLGAMFVGFGESSFEKVQAKGVLDGISLSWQKTISMSNSIIESFALLLTGKVSMKAMGGPVMIGKIAGDSLRLGWVYFLKMLAFISLNLAIMNLMPFPVLDGGHLLLFVFEGLFRRPLPIKIIEIWTTVGFFMLVSLALFVTLNDLNKLNVVAPILKLFGH